MSSTPQDEPERRPLLPSAARATEDEWPAAKATPTPLPLQQLLILALMRVAEPMNFTVIFPFVNKMMEDLKVTDEPSEIGFYSGLVDSSFAIAQCFTILQWGRLSDRIGRRPVIFIGLSGSVISIFLFGLSKNLAWALSSRSIAGALSGNIAVIQSILAEITDATNESKAMPLVSVTWSLGCVIGPLIGGTLLHPAEKWPSSPVDNVWFRKYPYSLPCTVTALYGLCALTLAYAKLKETNKRERHTISPSTSSTSTLVENAESASVSTPASPPGVGAILAHPPLRNALTTGFLISFLASAYDVVFALVCFSPIHLGGLSRTPAEIGYAFALGGVVTITLLPTTLPLLQRRYGTQPFNLFCNTLWPILYLGFPFINLLARRFTVEDPSNDLGSQLSPTGTAVVWAGIALLTITSRLAFMTFSLNIMMVKAAAPDKRMLGSTYGVSQTIQCVGRAVAPAFVSSIFALSVDRNLLQGNLVWYIMALIGVSCTYSAS